jgi:hypothetical protein
LQIKFKLLSLTGSTLSGGTDLRTTHFLHHVPFRGVSAARIPLNNYLRVCNIEGRWLSFFFFFRVSWQDKAMDDASVASGAWWSPLKMQIVKTARSFDHDSFFYNAYHALCT